MDYSRLTEKISPYAQALCPEVSAFVPRPFPSVSPSPLPQALRPQAPTFQPRAQSPSKHVLSPVLPTLALPILHRAVEKGEEELGAAPWATFDCPHCDRSNGCEWMIACSGEHEALEWAHLSCVGLSAYDFPNGADESKWYCPGCRNAEITFGDPYKDTDEDEEGTGGDDEDGEEADTGEKFHHGRKRKRVHNGAKTVPGGAAKNLSPTKLTFVASDEAAYQESEENSDDDYSSYSESGRDRKRSRMQLKRHRKLVTGKTRRLSSSAKILPPSDRRAGASSAVAVPFSCDAKRAMWGKSGPGSVPVPASFIKRTGAEAGPRGEMILGKHKGSPRQVDEVEFDQHNMDEGSRDGRRRRRAQIAALEVFDRGKGKRKRAEPTSTDVDEYELDTGPQTRRKCPRASAAAMPPHPQPRPAAVGTRSRLSSRCAKKAPPPARDDAWTESVSDKIAALVQERIDAGDHTEKKWHWIAAQLKLRHVIDKTHSAIKNYWGRNLRARYSMDERRVAKPNKLVTGLQSKEDRKRARELAKLKKGQLATGPISVNDDDV